MSKLKYFDGTNWNDVGNIAGDTLPIGAIVPFGGWDAPTGWLICDGTLLNKTAYPELFNAIGYSFGGEDGGSTFGLPDLRGRVPLGLKETDTDFDGMGLTGGSKTHTQTTDEVAPHTHQLWVESDQSGSAYGLPQSAMFWEKAKNNWANGQFGVNRTNVNTPQPMNIMNPYQTVNYIIKAKQSVGVVANVSNTKVNSQVDTYSCNYINGILNKVYPVSFSSKSSINITSVNGYGVAVLFSSAYGALVQFQGSGNNPNVVTIYGTPSFTTSASGNIVTLSSLNTWDHYIMFGSSTISKIE